MNAIDEYGAPLQELSKFVATLDPSVREEAFKFLLARQFGEKNLDEPKTDFAVAPPFGPAPQQERKLSPQELLRKVGASTGFDKAVLFGYWMEMFEGQQSFSGGKLREVFQLAREPAPSNPSDVVAKLERAGKFMRAEKIGGTQYYRLTRTAIEEIETKLS